MTKAAKAFEKGSAGYYFENPGEMTAGMFRILADCYEDTDDKTTGPIEYAGPLMDLGFIMIANLGGKRDQTARFRITSSGEYFVRRLLEFTGYVGDDEPPDLRIIQGGKR